MTCDDIHILLDLFVNDELGESKSQEVQNHLAGCSECTAEIESLRALADSLQPSCNASVPKSLWPSIERRLETSCGPAEAVAKPGHRTRSSWRQRRSWAIAAALAFVIGLGFFSFLLTESKVEAASVDFGRLLDSLDLDPQLAFKEFIDSYQGRPVTREQAKRYASQLNFHLPKQLPHGFELRQVYLLTFGNAPGVAASYQRDDEFLGTIFHAPVHPEDFGSHKDYACVIGQHRGHQVNVGPWSLVHLTDATTCRCILSRLKEELPAVLETVAIGMDSTRPAKEHGHH